MPEIQIFKWYTFKDLESFLQDLDNRSRALVVENKFGDHGMMHVFGGNFCGDWRSGDGVVFWNDKDVTSADSEDKFKLMQIIEF